MTKINCLVVTIQLLIVNPTNLSDLTNVTSDFRQTSIICIGMRDGKECWCSGALDKATLRGDGDCSKDCEDDPVENKRKCGGSGDVFSVWRLGQDYCPYNSRHMFHINIE